MGITKINFTSEVPKISNQNQQNSGTSSGDTFKNTLDKLSSDNSSVKTDGASTKNTDNLQSDKSIQDDTSLQISSKDDKTEDTKLKDAILNVAKNLGFSEDDLAKIKKLLENNTSFQQLLLMFSQNTKSSINLEELVGKSGIDDILKEIDNVLSTKLDSGSLLKLKDKLSSDLSNINLSQLLQPGDKESSTIDSLIEKAVSDLNVKVSKDDLKSLSNNIQSNILKSLSKNVNINNDNNVNNNGDFTVSDDKDMIKSYLMKLLEAANTKNQSVNKADSDSQTTLNQLRIKSLAENNNSNNLIAASSDLKQHSTTDKNNKDESFLNNLMGKDSKDSSTDFSRVTNFINQLSNSNSENNVTTIENANPILNSNNLQEDFIKTLKFMNTNDLQQLTVKIMPKELGEVVINLTFQGGAMKASISAANKDAYNLLNANLPDINNKLQNENIKIQNLTLNVYNDDTTFFKDGSQNQRQGRENSKNSSVKNITFDEGQDILNSNLSEEINNVNLFA